MKTAFSFSWTVPLKTFVIFSLDFIQVWPSYTNKHAGSSKNTPTHTLQTLQAFKLWRPQPRHSANFSQLLVQRAWNWQTEGVGSDCCTVSISRWNGVNDLVTATWQTQKHFTWGGSLRRPMKCYKEQSAMFHKARRTFNGRHGDQQNKGEDLRRR